MTLADIIIAILAAFLLQQLFSGFAKGERRKQYEAAKGVACQKKN